ncbi:hypothetical protein [Fusibacter bizertensis]
MPKLNVKARFLSVAENHYKDKKTQEDKRFFISKVFIDSSDEVAEVFSTDPVSYKRDNIVDIVINADLANKKLSVNFAK